MNIFEPLLLMMIGDVFDAVHLQPKQSTLFARIYFKFVSRIQLFKFISYNYYFLLPSPHQKKKSSVKLDGPRDYKTQKFNIKIYY